MEEMTLEVYSTTTNCAVVRPPGRRFPGVVIQGDTLSILCADANEVAVALQRNNIDENARAAMQMVLDGLVGSLLHHQAVLQQHGLELPYGEPRSRTDFATIYLDPEEPPDST
jgi:hypothetical protein